MSERLCSAEVCPAQHVTLQAAADALLPRNCAVSVYSPACDHPRYPKSQGEVLTDYWT